MNRTATIIIAAFATLTGCAPAADAGPQTGAMGFAGIPRSQPVGGRAADAPTDPREGEDYRRTEEQEQMDEAQGEPEDTRDDRGPEEASDERPSDEPEAAEQRAQREPQDEPSVGKPADVRPGTWFMNVKEVYLATGGAAFEEDSRQLSVVTEVDGVSMLQGMAAMMTQDDMLIAEQVDVTTARPEEGDCTMATMLIAEGTQAGPEAFEMDVYFEDSVKGEDCEKLGWGAPRSEAVAFSASFAYAGAAGEKGEGGAKED